MSALRKLGAVGSLLGVISGVVLIVLSRIGYDLSSHFWLFAVLTLGAIIAGGGVVIALFLWWASGNTFFDLLKSAPVWLWFSIVAFFVACQIYLSNIDKFPHTHATDGYPCVFAGSATLFYGLAFFYYWKVGYTSVRAA